MTDFVGMTFDKVVAILKAQGKEYSVETSDEWSIITIGNQWEEYTDLTFENGVCILVEKFETDEEDL